MIKKLLLAAAMVAAPMASASAQAMDPYPANAPTAICDLNIFTNVTATKCVGFFDKNDAQKGDIGNALNADQQLAMQLFGLPTDGTILNKVVYSNGDGNFGMTFYGITVVGYHWGNYPDDPDNIGNVSALYYFDAGVDGVSDLGMTKTSQGLSNGIVFYTGNPPCTGEGCNEVPEPSSFGLVAAGIAGLGIMVRRRRRSV